MPTALNDLLKAMARNGQTRLAKTLALCDYFALKQIDSSDFSSSPWCAFAPGKEAWKRDGNFFTSEELRQIDNADDLAIYQPLEPVLSAD